MIRYRLVLSLCLLSAIPFPSAYAQDTFAHLAAFDITPYLTKNTAVYSALTVFLLCSWRLFQKKGNKQTSEAKVTDLFKIWNIARPSYWQLFDALVIGQPLKKEDKTITKYNWDTETKEKYIEKVTKQEATGLFGYYIYGCILSPFKSMVEYCKPLDECYKLSFREKLLSLLL
ncbi:MAG TPA: hypothetical protein VGW78_00920 [Candidatus Babeliales bacterium]|jgi:hypothetical protein|nr:hypothetical protein [Candidatus Babeliales bacterium]